MRVWRAIAICLCCLGSGWLYAADDEEWNIQFSSPDSVEFDQRANLLIVTNGLVVKYGGAVLTAQRARVNQDSGETEANGDVRIEREGQVWKGDYIRYNFKTGEIR